MIKTLYKKTLKSISPSISITIPTFDRVENLLKLLLHISQERNLDQVEIILLDNKSPSVIDIKIIKKYFKNTNFFYYQNSFHLGPDVNYLKSIELANSEWVYPIGDSKIPKKGFISMILRDIKKYKDCMSIVYSYASKLKKNLIINTIYEIDSKKIHFGDFFLGGTSIISRKNVEHYLSQAGQITLSRMPHSLFHLKPLLDHKKIVLNKEKIIETFLKKPAHYDPKLSFLECWAQFALIDFITSDTKARKILNKKIFEVYGEIWRFGYHALHKLFIKRIDISSNIDRIIKFRYIHYNRLFDLPVIYLIFIISKVLKIIKYVK